MTQKRFPARSILVTLCMGLLSISAFSQRNARTLPSSLDQMVEQAETIVHGTVAAAKVEPHPELKNLTTVLVSMKVETILKGKPRRSFEFRQYIWDSRDRLDAAQYRKGQELLLLLGPVSRYGLTSPVGLDQGRFQITHDRKGGAVAVNGQNNRGLFQSTEQRAQSKNLKLSARTAALVRRQDDGPIALADLKEAIRNFAEVK